MSVAPSLLGAADSLQLSGSIGERFEVLGLLGRGGAGGVYRVRDRFSGRTLALKRVALTTPALRARFEREYSTLVSLAHPLIIRVYDYALESDAAYYTMELLGGQDFVHLTPMPYPQACRYLRQLATALALLHARGLVHRDVSTRNVRITEHDDCKLLDFGALAEIGEVASLVGTPPCVPPEALEREALDARVDLYALGCMAYFALTGRHAYPAQQIEQLPSYWSKPLAAPSACVRALIAEGHALPELPKELDDLVLSLLRLDRNGRPQSAGAIIDRLAAVLGAGLDDELALAERYLASPPTLGRDAQLQAAQQAGERVVQGEQQVLAVRGAEGSGKTQLLGEIALSLRLRGLRVVQIDARRDQRSYASAAALCNELFAVAPSDVIEVAAPYAEELCQLVPELAPVLLGRANDMTQRELTHERALLALHALITGVARRRPLALLLDNLHACDHASAALFARLAREPQHALLLIAALPESIDALDPGPCRALSACADETLGLPNLTPDELVELLAALFGRATPNLKRLGRFVHAHAGGQPRATIDLLYAMLRSQQLRYHGGTWALPVAPDDAPLPLNTDDMLRLRLLALGPDARALAEASCLYRGTLSVPLCHALCDLSHEAIERALAELVEKRILLAQRDSYTFAHEALRAALRALLPDERRVELQRRIAFTILSRIAPQASERLEAGLHLLEAGDEQGARLVCQSGVDLCMRPEDIVTCAPLLERALELFKASGRHPTEQATLLAPLSLAAYVVHHRYEMHSTDFITCFEGLTGLGLARRLRPFAGKHLSTFIGLAYGALRHALRPRLASFEALLVMFIGGIVALCGRAAICLDGPAARSFAAHIEPLTALGAQHATTYAYDYCRALAAITTEQHSETYALCSELERRLHGRGVARWTSSQTRQMWQGGLHYLLGLFESLASEPRVLERIAQLEASGFSVDHLIAAQLRRVYHTFRGEAEPVLQAHADVELHALQNGSSWQAETWSAVVTNYAAGLWGDSVEAKRAMNETERLAREIASLRRYAQSALATYQLQSGQYAEAIASFEDLLAREAPRERIGWGASVGLLASAYNQIGEHQRALELCEQVLQGDAPDDARYAALRLPAWCAMAQALSALGEHERARALLAELIERHAGGRSPLVLGSLHEAAARSAWLRRDRKAFTEHLIEVERNFCPLGQPALISRFLELTALGGREGAIGAKIAAMREVRAFENALARASDREQLARHAFAWLMQKCEGFDGYLFVKGANGPLLLASSEDRLPPQAAIELAARSMRAVSHAEVTTQYGPAEADTHAERPSRKSNRAQPSGAVLHVHLLSFVDQREFFGEGALVLCGRKKPPRLRHDLLEVAALHLRRLRANAQSRPDHEAVSSTASSA